MRIQSYTVSHYGKDYIAWALRSIFPFVEQAHVFYTSHPSHGHRPSIRPIEAASEIYEEAHQFNFDGKLHWHQTSNITHEGEQRDNAVRIVREAGADIIIVVDCDEIWDAQTLEQALNIVIRGNARNWLINFTHLWRSFNWCCRDQGWPVRFIDLRQNDNSNGYIPQEVGDIYHFGYAVPDKVMSYKWEIHGHKHELRDGWLEKEWQKKPPVENCHPTNERNEQGVGFWNTELFNKEDLPEFMRQHPFWHLDKIE